MFAERVSHVKPSAGVFAEDDDRAIPESGSAKNSGGSEIERPMFARVPNSQSQNSAFFKGKTPRKSPGNGLAEAPKSRPAREHAGSRCIEGDPRSRDQTAAFYCGLRSGPNGQGSSNPRVSELYVLGPICNQFLSAFEMFVSRLALNSSNAAGVLQT